MEQHTVRMVLREVADTLERLGLVTSMERVLTARVPILK